MAKSESSAVSGLQAEMDKVTIVSTMAKIKSSAVSGLQAEIDKVTSDPDGAPGIVFAAVNKNGDIIFEHASGKVGAGRQEPMTMETVFWIASCTKMITGIACMQLVEQGVLKLDDVASVEKLCPELKTVKVLQPDGNLVDKKRGITLRMLLSHTAGFGYSFFNERLLKHYGSLGLDEFSGSYYDFLSQPLVNQPGEAWEYGINIDYAGLCVERATGMSLNDYFQEKIFKPMGVKYINMFPTTEMVSKLAWMNCRDKEGKLSLNKAGHINRKSLYAKTKEEIDTTFNAGGAGCFARPVDYCQVIATLLNDGKHPKTGAQILKKETVEEMFTNQIPEFPDFARQGIPNPRDDLTNALPQIYPEPNDPPQGWGLTFFLHLQDSMVHAKGTGWWAGLPNLFWWCDRQRGLGGIIASQIVPFGDLKILGLWGQLEGGILQALE